MTPASRPTARRAPARLAGPAPVPGRPHPVVVAWRWRYELAVAACAASGAAAVALRYGPGWLVGAISGLVALVAGSPAGREFVVAQAWRIITPHRIRTCCAQAGIHSRSGKIPAVVVTTRQPFGERLLVWCPAGTSAEDLHSARATLAAACWASEVRVYSDPRYAHLVTVEVVRERSALS